MNRNFVFMSHSVQEFSFSIQNASRNFFFLNCNIFTHSEQDAGYFFSFTSCCRIIFTRTWLSGNFFSKKPTPALNDQMVGPQVTNVLLRQWPRFTLYWLRLFKLGSSLVHSWVIGERFGEREEQYLR